MTSQSVERTSVKLHDSDSDIVAPTFGKDNCAFTVHEAVNSDTADTNNIADCTTVTPTITTTECTQCLDQSTRCKTFREIDVCREAVDETQNMVVMNSYRHHNFASSESRSGRWRLGVLWRSLSAGMTVFLLVAAAVQWNDYNPYVWMSVYAVPGLLTAYVTWDPAATDCGWWRGGCLCSVCVSAMLSIYKVAYLTELLFSLGPHNPLIHTEGRELAGLLIIITWLSLRCSAFLIKCSPLALLVLACVVAALPLLAWTVCYVTTLGDTLAHCRDMLPPAPVVARITDV